MVSCQSIYRNSFEYNPNSLSQIDFINSRQVTTALKSGFKPHFNNLQGFLFRDGALAKGEAVAIVVGAIPNRDLFVPAEAAADAFDAIGHDGFTVAGAAQNDAAFDFA
jgi:hypothetical protein